MQTKVKKTIKELPKVDRPREKLMQYGPEKLSNSELLAILSFIVRFLLECLDKNHLYVNYSEIDDEEYGVNKEDKELNRGTCLANA
ncbi:MAG: UPF0758 domain-containing protein [bacterium]